MAIVIPHAKWIAVYNSITLCWFLVDSNNNNRQEIDKINIAYDEFCKKHGIPGQGFNVTSPENILLFGYAIVVRIFEIIEPAIKGVNVHGITAKEHLFRSIFDAADSYGCEWFRTYNGIIEGQEICISECSFSDLSDYEKLFKLVTHLRHSISHSTYELRDNGNIVYFESKHGSIVHLEATMPLIGFVNFILRFGLCLNRVLHEQSLLSE